MNNKKFTIGVILILLGVLAFSIIINGAEDKKGKGLCVDGNGNKNLEGIMCEKNILILYGTTINEVLILPLLLFSLLMASSMLIGFGLILSAATDGGSNDRTKL